MMIRIKIIKVWSFYADIITRVQNESAESQTKPEKYKGMSSGRVCYEFEL